MHLSLLISSVSDTGTGSSLVEFQELDLAMLCLSDKWGKLCSVFIVVLNALFNMGESYVIIVHVFIYY